MIVKIILIINDVMIKNNNDKNVNKILTRREEHHEFEYK